MRIIRLQAILTLFLLSLAHISNGQNLTAFRAYNNTTITLKTGIGSITPSNVGGNIDSVCRYLSIWDLQQVTNIGARTKNVVSFGRTSSNQSVLDSNGLRNSNNTNLLWQFTNISGKPTWLMGGAEHTYYGVIQPDTFTTLHSWGLRNVSGKFLFDIDTSTFVASKHKLDSVAGLAGSVDTNSISTRAWRQKGIDSVSALIHYHPSGTPTVTLGAAAGSGATLTSIIGDDRTGQIIFHTGTVTNPTGSSGGTILTLTFNTPYTNNVNVFWTPWVAMTTFNPFNDLTAAVVYSNVGGSSSNTTAVFTKSSGTASGLSSATDYVVCYQIVEQL